MRDTPITVGHLVGLVVILGLVFRLFLQDLHPLNSGKRLLKQLTQEVSPTPTDEDSANPQSSQDSSWQDLQQDLSKFRAENHISASNPTSTSESASNPASQASPDTGYKAFRKECADLWNAIEENPYRYIGKSVHWMIRVDYRDIGAMPHDTSIRMNTAFGCILPGRYGKCCVAVYSTNAADADIYARVATKILREDNLPSPGDWLNFEGVITSVDHDRVWIAPTALNNLGRQDDW